jgi:DNA-binding NarL/FixJ family response regulator
MKDAVLELYEEGMTIREIAEELGLAIGTVGTYIYTSGLNKNPKAREAQLLMRIRRLIAEYETEFGVFHHHNAV